MQEISTDVAKKIKMSREAELNMERCAEFMARMIQKYGKKDSFWIRNSIKS